MTSGAVFASRAAGVRLPPAYTLGIALAGTLLVLAGLLFAFSRPVMVPLTSPRMLLSVAQVPIAVPAAPLRRTAKPAESPNSAHTIALPQPLKANVLQDLPAPAASRLDLSMGIPAPTVLLPMGPEPHVFNPYSDLERALHAPRKPQTMKNNSSWRSIYGYTVSKVNGVCSYSVTLQHMSLSPSVHPSVSFVIPCPGDYRPSMADELAQWATAERKRQGYTN